MELNINLIDHRRERRERLWRSMRWRCVAAILLSSVVLGLLVVAERLKQAAMEPDWQQARAQEETLLARQAAWEAQSRVWAGWDEQKQAWWRLGASSQMPLRIWHWLAEASIHGVRWTHWQQEGMRWRVEGEANSLLDVQQWVASGRFKPIPIDQEVSVSQRHQGEDGRIGFAVSWEELP